LHRAVVGSSWIGPLVTAALNEAFGSMRYAIFFILATLTVSIVLVAFIDVTKAIEQVYEDRRAQLQKAEL